MKRIILLSAITAGAIATAGAAVINAIPGSLASSLENVPSTDTELEIKGRIDVRDLRAIASRNTAITLLDLSDAEIAAYSSLATDTHGQSFYSAGLIPQYTFFKADISKVILPTGLNEIGAGAFANSSLSSITIPSDVTAIGDHAFYGCQKLGKIVLPARLRSLGSYAFANCTSLSSAKLRDTRIETLPSNTFAGCYRLTEVTFPTILRSVGTHAFENTAITALNLPQVKEFSDYALAGMPELLEVTISPSAKIGTGLLMDDSKVDTVTGAPTDVPDLFAANCTTLYSDKAAGEASNIGHYAFANTKATTVVLSPTLTTVGAGAMAGVEGLQRIDARGLLDAIPETDPTAFNGINTSEIQLHVASDTEDTWMAHPVWGQFKVYSDTMTDIGQIFEANSGNIVKYDDQTLTVTALQPILSVDAYSLNGALLLSAQPGADSFSAYLPVNENVIMVRIVTEAGPETVKLMIK